MAPSGLALLATSPWLAAQRFRPAHLGLSLVSSGAIELIGFDRPVQLTTDLIGEGCIAQPPTPAVAGANMDSQLIGNTPRGTRQAQEKRGENPVHHRAFVAVQ